LINDVIVIDGQAETWEQALNQTYSVLLELGYVKDTFFEACCERERNLPTGLPTEIGVAIPHTDAEHVIIPAICVLRLKQPVTFRNMGDPDTTIEAHYVFNMALKANEDQVPMLKSIIHLVQNSQYLLECKEKPLDLIRTELMELWIDDGNKKRTQKKDGNNKAS
jgi:galactitol PTS system EIIA component